MIEGTGAIRVPTPGTPVQVILSVPGYSAGKVIANHAVMFEALPENTGRLYIGKDGMDKVYFTRVLAWLPIPTENFAPTFQAALTLAPNALVLNDFWIDADVADDGVLVTYLIL